MTVQSELNRAAPMIDGLNAAIRENPLAAGLIGAGVAWMLMGGAKGFGAMAGVAKAAAGKAGAAAASAGNAVAGGLAKAGTNAAAGMKDVPSEAAGSVGSIVPDLSVSDTMDDARSFVGDQLTSAAAASREYGSAIQSRLSESLERQPLLLGAIGLAIGAGIASAFATTSIESELMGQRGTAAREKFQELATDAKDRARQVLSDMRDEADKQGLTTAAAKNAAGDIAEKVKAVAGEARGSVTQSLSQPA